MKKILKICIIIFICLFIIKNIPLGSYKYKNKEMSSSLNIPKLSIFKEECCMFSANFKIFRSKYILIKELDRIMNKYEKILCNNKIYYYDSDNNITISNYGVESGIILNSYYIVYDKGKYICDDISLNEIENVFMKIKDGSLSSSGATIIITDLSGNNYTYGEYFRIDKKINNEWITIDPIIDNYGFNDIGYLIDKNSKLEISHNWEYLYGKLDVGEYRLVKEVNSKYFSVEFRIEKR